MKIILVKHAQPEIISNVPAHQWHLSQTGRVQSLVLAKELAGHSIDLVISSTETKAIETAQIVTVYLRVPFESVENLHEHDRRGVPFDGEQAFKDRVAEFFAKPNEFVFGNETADQAHARFASAISGIIAKYPQKNIAVVAHGTVITLYLSRKEHRDPFEFWTRLDFCDWVICGGDVKT